MKKVMIGILILIPILILIIVALVSNIISIQAWISVENVSLHYKGSETVADDISFSFENVANKTISFYDFLDVKVMPEKANNYTIEWHITGDVTYTDEEYLSKYQKYTQELSALKGELEAEYPDFSDEDRLAAYEKAKSRYGEDSAKVISAMADELLTKVRPAAAMVDKDDNEVTSNTSGEILISSYCKFTLQVVAENVSKTLSVSVVGDNVERVTLGNVNGEDNNLSVGDSKRLVASYTPIDSIVNYTVWHSDNPSVATVDQNGVVSAHSAGSANVTMQASVHSSEGGDIQYVTSDVYTISVNANGPSSKFGKALYTARTNLSLDELGVSNASAVEGCTIADGFVTLTAQKAVIATDRGNFEIISVGANSIAIENATFYENKENGFVLEVGEHALQLTAIFADELESASLGQVEWTSSNTDVATVNQSGQVKGVSNGVVVITARHGDEQTSIELNVKSKLASIQLRTSNASLAVGLARETVFASERYENGFEHVANFVNIVVQGEPKEESERAGFYESYVFEIVSGGQYAHFDSEVANKLVFENTLEGKGKQKIVVRVRAKYPKYEGGSKFTTEEVTINAIYGVSVANIAQLRYAAKEQYAYSHAEGNYLGEEMTYDFHTEGGRYFVYNVLGSTKTYAICFEANVPLELNEDGTFAVIQSWDNRIDAYGDIYGNNYMLSARKGQVESHLLRAAWPHITVSNLIMRANDLGDNTEISSAEDTSGFVGETAIVEPDDCSRVHMKDVRFEYCIFENGQKALTTFNSELTVDGCVMRNFSGCGMYIPQRMYWKDAEQGCAIFYSHVNFNNFTCSNMIASLMSTVYERFTITEKQDDGNGGKKSFGRFVRDDFEANEKYFLETLVPLGINLQINQTGFFDIYNWTDVDNANLIDTGDKNLNDTIGTLCGDLIRQNSAFENFRYYGTGSDEGKLWVHLAFVCTGISTGEGIFDEKTYLQFNSESNELNTIKTSSLEVEGDGLGAIAARLVKGMSVQLYGYDNQNAITPYSRYQINAAFIDRLH